MASNFSLEEMQTTAAQIAFHELNELGLFGHGAHTDVEAWRSCGLDMRYFSWWSNVACIELAAFGLVKFVQGRTAVSNEASLIDKTTAWENWWAKIPSASDDVAGLLSKVDRSLRSLGKTLTGVPEFAERSSSVAISEYGTGDTSGNEIVGLAQNHLRLAFVNTEGRQRIAQVAASAAKKRRPLLSFMPGPEVNQYDFFSIDPSTWLAQQWNGEWLAEQPSVGGFKLILVDNGLVPAFRYPVLSKVKALLEPHGALAMRETIVSNRLAMAFGWVFPTADDGAGLPFLTSDSLSDLLDSVGFRCVTSVPDITGVVSVLAESDGVVTEAQQETARGPSVVSEASAKSQKMAGIDKSTIEDKLAATISEILVRSLYLDPTQVAFDRPFSEYGLDSLLGVKFINEINSTMEVELNASIVFDHPSILALTAHLKQNFPSEIEQFIVSQHGCTEGITNRLTQPIPNAPTKDEIIAASDIAVIGMSGQFPMADDCATLWRNLASGVDAVAELPASYLDPALYSAVRSKARSSCKWGGTLNKRDRFDPLFFNLSPADAQAMNPHQRLVLQECWRSIEDAGYNPKNFSEEAFGIFVGAEPTSFAEGSFTGASEAIIAARPSYYLNLRGPAVVVNTGCSSSAMALHIACESLRSGEVDVALAGGVSAALRSSVLVELSAVGMLSEAGQCRSFDAKADGTIVSEAIGMVMLKRLSDAVRDGDNIYGVINASGANQDGQSNGITAPNGAAQEALIVRTYQRFGVDAEQISYVEAHGTGTKLGDPVEVNALVRAFRKFTSRQGFCRLGSIKSSIGHTSAAAGVVGLIKLLLCLQHRMLPSQMHFAELNPLLDIDGSPFTICDKTAEWAGSDRPRMAALSSFGHSGTNVHIVVREYRAPSAEPLPNFAGPFLIALSARSEKSLRDNVVALHRHLTEQTTDSDLADISFTLQTAREEMNHRLVLLVDDLRGLLRMLEIVLDPNGANDDLQSGVKFWKGTVQRRSELATGAVVEDEAGFAHAWIHGQAVDWNDYWARRGGPRRRVRLPTYRFEENSYPIRWPLVVDNCTEAAPPVARGGMRADVDNDEACFLSFAPRWAKVQPSQDQPIIRDRGGVVVIGATAEVASVLAATSNDYVYFNRDDGDVAGQLRKHLASGGRINRLVWIAPEVDTFAPSQADDAKASGVVEVFRLVRAFVDLGYQSRPLDWTFVTRKALLVDADDKFNPTHAGIHGFAGTLSREFSRWSVQSLDLDELRSIAHTPVLNASRASDGSTFALRNGTILTQVLTLIDLPNSDAKLRSRGCYIVVGGAGGLGEVWTKHVSKKYDAQVIWLGRRPFDQEISEKCDRIAQLGPRPIYIQADARDIGTLHSVAAKVKAQFGAIHGIVHAAVGAFDVGLVDTDEAAFVDVLSSKVDVGLNVAELAISENVETVLFFSSIASFYKTGGMAGYVAGSVFIDALAHWLSARLPRAAIKSINWGYWDSGTGTRVSEQAKLRWRNYGFVGIDAIEGMELLDSLAGSSMCQLAAVKTRRPQALEMVTPGCLHLLSSTETSLNTPSRLTIPADTLRDLDPRDEHLDELMRQFLKIQLTQMDGIASRSVLSPQYTKWVQHAQRYLDGARSRQPAQEALSRDAVLQKWKDALHSSTTDPSARANMLLLDVCLSNLPDILAGRRKATDVMFPNGSMALVEDVYKNNAVSAFFNTMLSAVLMPLFTDSDNRTMLRVLEVGAGTGGTTEHVLPLLDTHADRVAEYKYTDISRYFLSHAIEKYMPTRKMMSVDLLDISKDVESQGFKAGSYDIVIAANCLHATRNIHETLANCKILLRQGGKLILNEIAEPTLFTHLTFGLLDGWWMCEDPEVRLPGSPILSPDQWKAALRNEGFHTVEYPCEDAHGLGCQLVVATSDGIIHRQSDGMMIARATGELTGEQQGSASDDFFKHDEVKLNASKFAHDRDAAYVAVIDVLANVLKMDRDVIDEAQPLSRYGVDSLVVMEILKQLEAKVGEIDSGLLFEANSISELIDKIAASAPRMPGIDVSGEKFSESEGASKQSRLVASARSELSAPLVNGSVDRGDNGHFAIIGIVGRYPQASTVSQFWENLANGKECISTIQGDRWPLEEFYDPAVEKAIREGKSYSLACGQLEGFSEFDAEFFGISPAEALNMDPQERLLVQSCWHLLEDAGYPRDVLRRKYDRRVGVFLGITRNGYALHGRDLWTVGGPYPFSSFSSAANRVSYLLDLQGPSMPIDTMCSSSLTAIHEACNHIMTGDCELAIAGGVNLYLHPENYIGLCADRMISKMGKTLSFGAGGDGFVPGEGVGTILIKRLAAAIADHDNIHAVIRATSVNHGGRAMKYATPTPSGYSAVIRKALEKSGARAEDVTYVEAHGTGTELGDAIELSALSKAYAGSTVSREHCAIGSCKSNIGHLEAAAGIAAVTKVVMQMQHQKIAPTLGAETPNPRAKFEGSPFALQHHLGGWQPASKGAERQEGIRLAGVSAFGAAGSNAHIIMQEFVPHQNSSTSPWVGPVVVPLSARNESQLVELAQSLLEAIEAKDCPDNLRGYRPGFNLLNLAYTLQTGREALRFRVALVVETSQELKDKLRAFLELAGDDHEIGGRTGSQLSDEQLDPKHIEQLVRDRAIPDISILWQRGAEVNWEGLYNKDLPWRISLPLYPFAKTRYWQSVKAVPLLPTGDGSPLVVQADTATIVAPTPESKEAGKGRRQAYKDFLIDYIRNETGAAAQLDITKTFFEMGVSSVELVRLLRRIIDEFGIDVDASAPFDYRTITTFSEFLTAQEDEQRRHAS